ncbi:MAG: toxin-antitoxin system YwqK family antitoxin [Planctomycetales bacterium]|nr:toxin-antitoxin system YwqK family antitoxin [Planctomycetales bacterium]
MLFSMSLRRFAAALPAAAAALSAVLVAAAALAADPVYLDEPRPEPPPKVMGKITIPEKYEDGSVRVEREVLRMSDDTLVNDGKFVEYYRDGQKFAEGTFKEGVHNGQWTFWHPNGQVCKVVNFVDGQADGEWDVLGPEGELRAHKSYKDGKRDGTWIIYHADGKTPRLEQTYVNHEPNGERRDYYANGQLSQTSQFKNGKLNGPVVQYDESGRKTAEAAFVDGKRDGTLTIFNADGTTIVQHWDKGRLVVKGQAAE